MNALLVAAAALAVGACSPGPAPVSHSPRDPSSPSAPEGAQPAHEHAHHDHGALADATGATDGAAYACPMHPEVTSNAPGVCPKCNMKLVPKK